LSTQTSTLMLKEAHEAPQAIARQLVNDTQAYDDLGALLREMAPSKLKSLLTVARGSSDHAAAFMAYLIMARLGHLVTSLPMSLITLYQSQIKCDGLASFAFSQSGQSPDLVAPTKYFSQNNAVTSAFVNDAQSPLALASKFVFPLHAGPEKSVAATKSFIAQLVAGARVVAAWQDDAALKATIANLPVVLEQAVEQDWSVGVEALKDVDRLFVISRGTGLAVAKEAALKFKETSAIQAEAFSGAEVKHGPMALITEGYPVLVFAPRGPAQTGLLAFADEMRQRGAVVLLAAPAGTPNVNLPLVECGAVDLDPICAIQSFYPMVEAISRARGFNPDEPRFLNKVTRTQ
jgi:glutamine---fructose-6-phosphate transaminase (isomerizing)